MKPLWTIDEANRVMRSARYEASLQPQEHGGFQVATVRHRTDVVGADNLGDPLSLEVAISARRALDAYQKTQR